MTDLAVLVAEREPDPDAIERERLTGTPAQYRDPRFYGALEQLLTEAVKRVRLGR